jgi:hypothetical protein
MVRHLFTALVLSSIAHLSAGQQAYGRDDWEFANPNVCFTAGAVPCRTKVSVDCVTTGGYLGPGVSCINQILGQDETPFYNEVGPYDGTCGVKEIDVKVTFKLCNENSNDDIILDRSKSWIKFENIDVEFSFANIGPKKCRTVELDRTWDLCTVSDNKGRRRRPLEIQLDGEVADEPGNDKHCYCYTYRRSTHLYNNAVAPPPPPATKPPSAPTPTPPAPSKGKGKGKKRSWEGGRTLRKNHRNRERK